MSSCPWSGYLFSEVKSLLEIINFFFFSLFYFLIRWGGGSVVVPGQRETEGLKSRLQCWLLTQRVSLFEEQPPFFLGWVKYHFFCFRWELYVNFTWIEQSRQFNGLLSPFLAPRQIPTPSLVDVCLVMKIISLSALQLVRISVAASQNLVGWGSVVQEPKKAKTKAFHKSPPHKIIAD